MEGGKGESNKKDEAPAPLVKAPSVKERIAAIQQRKKEEEEGAKKTAGTLTRPSTTVKNRIAALDNNRGDPIKEERGQEAPATTGTGEGHEHHKALGRLANPCDPHPLASVTVHGSPSSSASLPLPPPPASETPPVRHEEAAHKGETCNPQGGSIQERIAMLKQKQQSSSPLILPSYASPPIKTPAVDDDPPRVVDGIKAAKSLRLAGLGTKDQPGPEHATSTQLEHVNLKRPMVQRSRRPKAASQFPEVVSEEGDTDTAGSTVTV